MNPRVSERRKEAIFRYYDLGVSNGRMQESSQRPYGLLLMKSVA